MNNSILVDDNNVMLKMKWNVKNKVKWIEKLIVDE